MFLGSKPAQKQEVEILDYKSDAEGNAFYLVKWSNNAQNTTTWQSLLSLKKYYHKVREFEKQYQKKDVDWSNIKISKPNTPTPPKQTQLNLYLKKIQQRNNQNTQHPSNIQPNHLQKDQKLFTKVKEKFLQQEKEKLLLTQKLNQKQKERDQQKESSLSIQKQKERLKFIYNDNLIENQIQREQNSEKHAYKIKQAFVYCGKNKLGEGQTPMIENFQKQSQKEKDDKMEQKNIKNWQKAQKTTGNIKEKVRQKEKQKELQPIEQQQKYKKFMRETNSNRFPGYFVNFSVKVQDELKSKTALENENKTPYWYYPETQQQRKKRKRVYQKRDSPRIKKLTKKTYNQPYIEQILAKQVLEVFRQGSDWWATIVTEQDEEQVVLRDGLKVIQPEVILKYYEKLYEEKLKSQKCK